LFSALTYYRAALHAAQNNNHDSQNISHFSPCMHPNARYIRDITTPPFLRQKTLIKKPIKAAASNAGDLINWLCTKGGAYIFWGSRASLVLICKKQRFA
jgi:hypothetical protein